MTKLLAQQVHEDERVVQAKNTLLQTLQEYQKTVTGIRTPASEHTVAYEEALAQFGDIRGGALYYPYIGSGFGAGPFVELADGSIKYDLINGIGVYGTGHGHPMFVEAALNAAFDDTIMQGNLQQTLPSMHLSKSLLNLANRTKHCMDHCFLSSSGAMANENALKMCFHQKKHAHRVIAFENSFSGRTFALSQLTDRPQYRIGLPNALDVDFIPFLDHENPEASTARSLEVLESHLNRHPGDYGCIWLELVQGEGGYYPGSHDYFVKLIELCRKHEVPIVADEVQTFARTTQPFAFQTFGLEDLVDVVTIGKSTQVCATLFRTQYKPGPGLISQTFTASSSAVRAGLAFVQMLADSSLYGDNGDIAKMHQRFEKGFEDIRSRHPEWVSGPYGFGGMIAFTPFDGGKDQSLSLLKKLYHKGVIGFFTGQNPFRVRFLPPLGLLQESDYETIFAVLEESLGEVANPV